MYEEISDMATALLCACMSAFKSNYPCIQPLFKNSAVSSACFSPRFSICPKSISREAAMHDDQGDESILSNTGTQMENIISKKFDKVKDQVLEELDIAFARLKERATTSDADYCKPVSRIEGKVKCMVSRLGYVESLDSGNEFSTEPEEMFNGRVVRYYLHPFSDKFPAWLGPAIAAAGLLSLALALRSWRMLPHNKAGLVNGSHQMTIEVSTANDGKDQVA